MKKFAPLLALLVVGVALAADPVAVVLSDPADAKAAAEAQASCDAACKTTKVFRERLARAEAEEARCKAARAKALGTVATKLGVTGKAFSVRVSTVVDGDGAETKTVTLVASQE
jgi:hypothetical protein